MPELPGAAGLSQVQKMILGYLWAQTARMERLLQASGEHDLLALVQYWGPWWYPSRIWQVTRGDSTAWTPKDRAVISRALRRLEQRGLVERKNRRTGGSSRTTNVRLTEHGRKIAKRLRKS